MKLKRTPDILLPPNLLSISRIAVTPIVGYFLAQNTVEGTIWCVVLMVYAALTDGLDGYIARRFNMTSGLGLYLDPLADKIFAAVMLTELVVYRELPVWLAVLIIGRDVLILALGLLVIRQRQITTPSNITGQYTFSAVVLLIGFYVIRFQFGCVLMTVITVVLIAASVAMYGYRLRKLLRGAPITPFKDKLFYRVLRIVATVLVAAVCIVKFIADKLH